MADFAAQAQTLAAIDSSRKVEVVSAFNRAFGHLSARDRDILGARYGVVRGAVGTPMSVADTARKLGYSRERVRKVESGALTKCNPEHVAALLASLRSIVTAQGASV